jgi:hypothetical protein
MNDRTKNLQTAAQAKLFLEELANLEHEPESLGYFWKQYGSFFPQNAFRVQEDAEAVWPLVRPESLTQMGNDTPGAWATQNTLASEHMRELRAMNLSRLRDELRSAWEITEPRRKEWKLFRLREFFHQVTASHPGQMTEPPPPSGMDFALRYLLRVMYKARTCENPECKSRRYFISDRRARRFCSDACAKPAQSEYKSKWWLENRDRLSRARKQKYREHQRNKEKRP